MHRHARTGSGSFLMKPFWPIKPLEADAVDFSVNNHCLSAALFCSSIHAWEVRLEGRARNGEHGPHHPASVRS